MLKQLIKFYHISTPATPLKKDKKKLKRLQWATFLSATAGYGIYYVCRLSLNVVKKPIVEEGIFSETELGIIGAVLFFTYAIGKFTNGFGKLMPRIHPLFHSIRHIMGNQRMVSVNGDCFLRSRIIPLV